MKGSTRNIIIVAIVVALLVLGIVLAIYNNNNASKPISAKTTNKNILDDPNKGLENLINDIFDDENKESNTETENAENVENNEANEAVTNNETGNSQNTNTQSNHSVTTNTDSVGNKLTPGESKAIELAKQQWKKEWGNLNGVSFNNVSIQSNGKYIVSVNDSKTTAVIARYAVDVVTGLVEETN